MEANAVGDHRVMDHCGRILILARQDSRRDVDDGDVAAQSAEGLGHFAADRARADHDQRRDGLAQIEYGFVGEIGCLVEAGERRYGGPRPGGDDEGFRGEPAAVDLERVGCDELSVAEDDVDAETAEALRAVVGLDAA